MIYDDAFKIAGMNDEFVEGFVKCTFVQLYDKTGHFLFTVKFEYSNWPNIAFKRNTEGRFDARSVSRIPICRAYTYRKKPKRVPVLLSPEMAWAIQKLIFNSATAQDPWQLWRWWGKDGEHKGKKHKAGEKELLTMQYDTPDVGNGEDNYIVKKNEYYTEYWEAPQYTYALTERYLRLLEIIEANEPVYVKKVAIDWYTDAQVVTTIADNILLTDDGRLITDKDGEVVKLYDENGNEIPTDEYGRPIIPGASDSKTGSEALAAAKKRLDNAKTLLAATGAMSFL